MKITITQEGKQPIFGHGADLFLYDVNHAIDGGLYAELLENHNFEAKVKTKEGFAHDGAYAWEVYPAGANVALKMKTDRPLIAENPHYMRVTCYERGAGFKNRAFGGITLVKGCEYKISLYVRSYDYKDKFSVGFFQGGDIVRVKKFKVRADGIWHRYTFRLKAKADMGGVDFAVLMNKEGMIHVDRFSVMPASAVFGVFRKDFVRLLKEMKPGSVHFFGGKGAYPWKQSVGERKSRVQAPNPAASEDFPHYGQTFGVGCLEYFRLAEYLGAEPVPVLWASGDFESSVQDAFDLIEFALGGTDTMWGKLRAQLGHGTPFALHTVAIAGQEKEALKVRLSEKFPEIQLEEEAEMSAASGAWEEVLTKKGLPVPTFGRIGYLESKPLVLFNGEIAFGTARYHLEKLKSLLTGDRLLQAQAEDQRILISCSERDIFTAVHVANPTAEEPEVEIEGDFEFGSLMRILCLSGEPTCENTEEEPYKIVPKDIAPTAPRTAVLPPFSYTVLIFRK